MDKFKEFKVGEGMTCICGNHEPSTLWAAAHIYEGFNYECPKCGRKYGITEDGTEYFDD